MLKRPRRLGMRLAPVDMAAEENASSMYQNLIMVLLVPKIPTDLEYQVKSGKHMLKRPRSLGMRLAPVYMAAEENSSGMYQNLIMVLLVPKIPTDLEYSIISHTNNHNS